jgi:hypothetical protein
MMLFIVFTIFQTMSQTTDYAHALSTNQTANLYVEPPLKQFKAGVPLQMILCKLGLTPIMKVSDHTPACVTPATAKILIQRGWGEYLPPQVHTSPSNYRGPS